MKIINFINSLFLIVSYVLIGQNTQKQSGFGSPISFPTPTSVFSFSKYGNVPVNEYRGLANIAVPLYDIKLDEVVLPLKLTYFTGGIKVAQEAGIVGLGWDMNLPAVTQIIKDEDDFKSSTKFTKLPDYVGNPFLPTRGRLHPTIHQNFTTSYEGMPYDGTSPINFLDEPTYFIASGNFIVSDGHYNQSIDSNFYGHFYSPNEDYDSEADIFKVNLNGVELVMMRRAESTSINPQYLEDFVYSNSVLKIINGREEYKVELVNESAPIRFGIKIIDPNSTQYFFEKINDCTGYNRSEGFLQKNNSTTAEKSQYKIYNLTKIITSKGKEINLEYESNTVTELAKNNSTFYRRIGNVGVYSGYPEGNYDAKHLITANFDAFGFDWENPNFFDDGLRYFDTSENVSQSSQNWYYQKENYNFLKKIITVNEILNFAYSDRIDYEGMRKLDFIEVKNIYNNRIKKYNFTYDYFDSPLPLNFGVGDNPNTNGDDGIGGTSTNPPANNNPNFLRLHKRLKLLSVGNEGEQPSVFTYDTTQLPPKNSHSIDYWGYYNGWNNTSFLLSVAAMGYGNLGGENITDNIQNNFNADINYTKAGSLIKITYPTKGYTELEYQLNEFDDYLRIDDYYTPHITQGAGLRIYKITNYLTDDTKSNSSTYSYFGGKNIFKKTLIKNYSMRVLFQSPTISSPSYMQYSSSVLELSLANYLSSSVTGSEDYIGYDKVEITDNFEGKVIKTFFNQPYKMYSCVATKNFSPNYFKERYEQNNGNLLSEEIYDSNNQIKKKTTLNYKVITSNEKRYGMKINGFDTYIRYEGLSDAMQEYQMPSFLLTFYPIFANSNLKKSEKTTDYFSSGSVSNTYTYTYDIFNNIINTKQTNLSGQILTEDSNTFSGATTNSIYLQKNLLNLPLDKVTIMNNKIKDSKYYKYEESNGITRLKVVNLLPEGNPDPNKTIKMFYDLYDDNHNLLQYHQENGINTSVIWGYKQTLPVAKIENIDYGSIPQNLILNIQTASASNDEVHLQIALDNLRTNAALAGAMVTTYTHIPLVGVSTITDTKGDKTTYSYDAYGRLINVKDKDGNLLSENQYNYKH